MSRTKSRRSKTRKSIKKQSGGYPDETEAKRNLTRIAVELGELKKKVKESIEKENKLSEELGKNIVENDPFYDHLNELDEDEADAYYSDAIESDPKMISIRKQTVKLFAEEKAKRKEYYDATKYLRRIQDAINSVKRSVSYRALKDKIPAVLSREIVEQSLPRSSKRKTLDSMDDIYLEYGNIMRRPFSDMLHPE